MSISYITHRNEQIMFADYRDKKETKDQLELLEEVAKAMTAYPEVRLLVDYTGMPGNAAYMKRVKELGNTVFKKHMKCSAVLGVTGLKKILFNGYNQATGATNVKTFDNQEAALDWLVDYT
jgi:hypothetical protein